MKRLNELQNTADEMLGGIQADNHIKYRILHSVIENARRPRIPTRSVAVLSAAAIVFVVIGSLVLPKLLGKIGTTPIIESVAAGKSDSESAVQSKLLDLPHGSIKLSDADSIPSYRGVWADRNGSNFPLIRAEGRFYRLLASPSYVDETFLGEKLGNVDTFTSEPALAQDDGIVSNIAQAGEAVYTVRNMKGAMAAVKVDGKIRVFQRVSYGNSARLGEESLADTLRAESVTGLEMSGVGTITDSGVAIALLDILFNNAVFSRSAGNETGQALLIQLSSGLVLQMAIKDGSVIACGTWDCPEFFEAFREAVK